MDFCFENRHFQAVQTDDPVNSCIDLYKSPYLNGKTLITPHVTGVFLMITGGKNSGPLKEDFATLMF